MSLSQQPYQRRRHVIASLLIVQILFLGGMVLNTVTPVQAGLNTDWPFTRLWERTDWPVATGAASRSWYWGPAPFAALEENYAQSPNLSRNVSYWDKSRMEVTYPKADQGSKWYVTNGLLVREMVSGFIQTGDNADENARWGAANVPVSGDKADINPDAPTYASFSDLVSLKLDKRANRSFAPVALKLDKSGLLQSDASLASRYPETAGAYYDDKLGHNIPQVMWQFMTLRGPVTINHRLSDQTIEDWIFAFGLPLSEAYWTRSRVAGVERDVLVQLFERRSLTYTPTNPTGFKVEMGNVGRHYFEWRYRNFVTKPGATPVYTQPSIRLNIPKIGVDAAIEYVAVLPSGEMDTPAKPENVAWYRYGPRPGEIGNAVIAGHRDYHGIGAVVFWKLDQLKVGDYVYVDTSLQKRLTFQVSAVTHYPAKSNSSSFVFGYTSATQLNLITCSGTFDSSSASYSDRLVVTTKLVE